MKRRFSSVIIRSLIVTTCIVACAQFGRATTVIIPSDDDLIIGARAIVRAKVLAVETGLDEQQETVYTYITLRVRRVLKGYIAERRIILKERGGEYGSVATVIFGQPEFSVGEEVIVYLDTRRDGSLRVHQMLLGKFSIVRDAASGVDFAVRNPDENVRVMSHSSGGVITEKMELGSYLQMIRERLAANLDRAIEFEEQHYKDVPILAVPSSYNPVFGGIAPQFRLFGPARWFQPDTGQSVTYVINPAGAPTATYSTDITAALNAWSTVSGCSLRLVNGGTTSVCPSSANTLTFNGCDQGFSAPSGCSGVLAVGGFNTGFATKVVNGTTFSQITRGYVSFNPFMTCYLNDSCRLREVATHEIGHSVGLHHSWQSSFGGTPTAAESDATMFWSAHNDGRCASIRQDDINGITFIYPGAAGGGGSGSDTVGLYFPGGGSFFLRNSNTSGSADMTFGYGPASAGWVSISGDWNGDGIDTVGLYNTSTSTFFLRNSNSAGVADVTFSYGPTGAGWIPISGDWNGDGTDTVGLYSPSSGTFFLRNSNSPGVADVTFSYGPAGAGWIPISGDWNGNGTDTVGLYSPSSSMFFLRNSNTSGVADVTLGYGPAGAGWKPLAGDWNGDGADTIGLYSPSSSMFFLRNSNTSGVADLTVSYGPAGAGWVPRIGDWNGA